MPRRFLTLTLVFGVVLAAGAAAMNYARQRRLREPYRYVGDIGRLERLDYIPPSILRPNAPIAASDSAATRLEGWIADSGFPLGGQSIWLGVGDSTTLFIGDSDCVVDACEMRQSSAVPTWSIDDGSVAAFRSLAIGRPITRLSERKVVVVFGQRVGRTTVRAFLPLSASDTLPGRTPPGALRKTLNVTLPVERVKLEQVRPDTLRAEAPAMFRAYAYDKSGRRIVGAPVEVTIASGNFPGTPDERGLALVFPERAGRQTVVASLRGRADTLVVQVLPSAR